MSKYFSREEIHSIFDKTRFCHRPILVTTAGIGLSAKFEQRAKTDMVSICSGSIFAMDGHNPLVSLLPYGNANEMVVSTLKRVASQVTEVPLMAGICATDPTIDLVALLDKLAFYKVSAVFNSPSIGIVEGEAKRLLEKAGIRYEDEVATLTMASKRGFYTMGAVYNSEQASAMARAGVDAIICDLGFTLKPGDKRNYNLTEESEIEKLKRMTRAIRAISTDTLVLLHGGLINSPESAQRILPRTGASGLMLASAVERIPIEEPLVKAVQEFKSVTLVNKGGIHNG